MAGHGSNPATWTAVIIALAGFTIGGIGLVIGPHWVMFWVGLALLPIAAIVGKIMSTAGMGHQRTR